MDVSLLHQAAAQAKTGWLEQALTDLLLQVWELTTETPGWQETASNWAAQVDRLFEGKKLFMPGQQKNRRTDIANALRILDPNHPVIPFVLLPSEIYTEMNNEQANRLNARENKFFSTQQADELVQRAIALLDSDNPDNVAAGLSILVGRRISEILLSQFRPKTAYSLLFSQAVKRRGEMSLEFEIPTLGLADPVLKAIAHLKQIWTIEDLKALGFSNNHLKRRINARYSGVPDACRKHFSDLVPGREAQTDDGKRLYTHLFRAVYAEIATYYYKPQWVPDHRFKAEIQGHFKLTGDGQKIPNYSARQSYDDYLIRDRSPGMPGVKLATPKVEILEVFQKERGIDTGLEVNAIVMTQLAPGTINALLYRAVNRLLFSNHWAEAVTALVLVTGQSIKTLMEKCLEEKSGFSILVDGLEVPTLSGATQVVAAWKKWQQLEPLTGVQVDAAVREVCDLIFDDLATLQSVQDLRAVYSAIALHWFCPPEIEQEVFLRAISASQTAGFETVNGDRGVKLGHHNVQGLEGLKGEKEEREMRHEDMEEAIAPDEVHRTKPRYRRKALSVDADLLRTVAVAFGLEIRGKGGAGGLSYEAALAQLLAKLAREQGGQKNQSAAARVDDEGAIAAIKDQAKTLAWLTGRVEGLEHQIETLKQERDQAIAQRAQPETHLELEQMRQENERLKQECDQATHKLQTFRQLLNGEEPNGSLTNDSIESQPSMDLPIMPSKEVKSAHPTATHRRLSHDDALYYIRQAIYTIMALNDQPERVFEDKWYISFPVVQALLRANGLSANQKNIAAVFEQLKDEMDKHHEKHKIGSRHNRKHPNIRKIAQLVVL